MWAAKGDTKAETNGDPDDIILHPKAKGGNRKSVQPGTRLPSSNSQEPGT
jgi:hypothetical protein